MKYLTVDLVIRIHEWVIRSSGGDPSIRDLGLVDSAVAQPRMAFGGQALYPALPEKAAALAFSLNRNHPFADGNKRTSHAAMVMFLKRNGHTIEATVDEQERIFLGVAAGAIDRETFTDWVKSHVVRRTKTP